ncbi:MAG: type I restriction endonuclease subunit R [Methanosphaera stadtmanae]|nr:type I restriction endonuclease subunit R [Methanosphaera stadtmanae]
MVKKFNEDTRVKLPATIQFLRLGYDYVSVSKYKSKNCIDKDNNIFIDRFKESIERINNKTFSDVEIEKIIHEIHSVCNNNDLGKEFYNWLINPLDKVKLIDFDNIDNNDFAVCCELPFKDFEFDESFRPDVNVLINGMPLAFLEVKKPNNPGGIAAEFNRMKIRLSKQYFSKFFNMFQIISFSNNMPYEISDNVDNLRAGSFYSTPNGENTNYSFLREDNEDYLTNYKYEKISDNDIEVITQDCGYDVSNCNTPEFKYNLKETTPCNKFITSLYDKERFLYFIKYGIMFIDDTKLEKHIMRYPQFFATQKIIERFESGGKNGIIWHTQGSGKTALVAFANKVIKDYFSKQNINTKFFFIVDRLDLLTQAKIEFENRGFHVAECKNKEEFSKELNKPLSTNMNADSIGEICVVNIHKFEEDIPKSDSGYGINLQRVFFIDEAHRSYKHDGTFFKNLLSADENGIYLALTGTPLLTKRERTNLKFGDYIHKYFYDKSISDGYTLRIYKEEIDTEVKEKIRGELKEADDTDLENPKNNESPSYIGSICDFIQNDFINFRKSHNDQSVGAMIVGKTNPQARLIYAWLKENSNLSVGLVISDDEQDEINKENQLRFRNKGNIENPLDVLVVNRMLTTGYDVPRLKKLYLLRGPKAHSLLQTISRVNRPYTSPNGKKYKYGYIVDFVDIGDEFDITFQDYMNELELDFNGESDGDESLEGVVINPDSIFEEYLENKAELDSMNLTTTNAEIFSQEINYYNNETLYKLRNNLKNMKEAYMELLISRDKKHLNQIDYNNINNLLKCVNDKISFNNIQEDPFDTLNDLDEDDIKEVIYSFKKVTARLLNLGVEELDSNFGMLEKLVIQIRTEIKENDYHQDPQLMELDNWTKQILNEFKEEHFNIEEIIEELKTVLEEVRKINSENERLKQTYGGNPAFVKTYHFVSKNYKLDEDTKKIILNLIYNDIVDIKDYNILISRGRRNFVNQIKQDTAVELYNKGIFSKVNKCYEPILNEFYYNLKSIVGEEYD